MSPKSPLNPIAIHQDDQEALSAPNAKAQEEEKSFEAAGKQETAMKQAELDDYVQNISLRNNFRGHYLGY